MALLRRQLRMAVLLLFSSSLLCMDLVDMRIDYIFCHACQELFGVEVGPGQQVPWEPCNTATNDYNNETTTTITNKPLYSARLAPARKHQQQHHDFYQAILYQSSE